MADDIHDLVSQEIDDFAKLSNLELHEVLKAIVERQDSLEDALSDFVKQFKEWHEFISTEILKARCEIEGTTQKTPYKRLIELEESFNGFLKYYNEHLDKSKKTNKKESTHGITPL